MQGVTSLYRSRLASLADKQKGLKKMKEEKKTYVYNQEKNVYTQGYIREHYKQLSIRLPKEGDVTRESIAAAAKEVDKSTNAYIVEAVREKMIRQGFFMDVQTDSGNIACNDAE